LHGSLKWGYGDPPYNPFELYEYATASDGMKQCMGSRSGKTTQRGDSIPKGSIITGLDKAQAIYLQPFFSNYLAFSRALELCSDILFIGFSFSDLHITEGIHHTIMRRPDVNLYIVDYVDSSYPPAYLENIPRPMEMFFTYSQIFRAKELPNYPGWLFIPQDPSVVVKNGIYLWPKGFEAFCDYITSNPLPS
jgi:hypothetical protein